MDQAPSSTEREELGSVAPALRRTEQEEKICPVCMSFPDIWYLAPGCK